MGQSGVWRNGRTELYLRWSEVGKVQQDLCQGGKRSTRAAKPGGSHSPMLVN